MVMAATVHPQELGPKLAPLKMVGSQLATFHAQDVRTPPTMAADSHLGHSQGASLDHLLAHLESSKQALEHQVQQLLQENRLNKSAKKEQQQQWGQVGAERLHSKLETMSVTLVEKEERIRRLEKELRDTRSSIQQMQSRCREAEKEKGRGALDRVSLQAALEDTKANLQSLDREYKSKQDVAEKQRRALESLADKVEKQKEFFQNQLEDARRRLVESEERGQQYEHAAQFASQQMAEKERQLKSLRDAHEKLLAVQKGKQAEERHELREMIEVLESTHAKCEEQKALIKELEQELGLVRKDAQQLDARASIAEADALSKSAMLEKAQLELKNTVSHVVPLSKAKAHIEDLKAQVETLKRKLQEVENSLSEESALRFKAECALHEYKVREKSLLKIEQDGKSLQEEVKWRNEQFESLEEAHNRMRDQFHEGRSMWAAEKAAMVRDIEVLTENVQSRDIAIHDVRSQVKLLQQSLVHEENCRKLVEFQLADAKAGMESVSAEYLSAQSILETLRENSKTELALLKDTLTEKDNQLKELHNKQKQIDRDQKELTQLEAELDSYKRNCEHLQQALENRAEQEILARELLGDDSSLNSDLDEDRDSLSDAEATIAAKDLELEELHMELDRAQTLVELLRSSLAESDEKHLQEKSSLEQAIASKQDRIMDLETEVARLRAIVSELETELDSLRAGVSDDDVRYECNAEADEARITLLEERLRDAQLELQVKKREDDEEKSSLELAIASKQGRVTELETEVERLRAVVSELETELDRPRDVVSDDDVRYEYCNTEAEEARISLLEEKLCDAHCELQAKKREADETHLKEKSSLEQAIASKQDRVMELETELGRLRAVVNDDDDVRYKHCNTEAEVPRISFLEKRLRDAEMELQAFSEADAKHLEEKSSLEQAIASKEYRVTELEAELDNLREVESDDVVRYECNTEADARISLLEERLRDAHLELQAKSDVAQMGRNVHEHESEGVVALRSECEALQRQLRSCEAERAELEEDRDKVVVELREKKQVYRKEKEELVTKLEHLSKQCAVKDSQVTELRDQTEREKQAISALEARCAASEQELSKQLSLVDHAREELVVWKLNAQAYKERAQLLDASMSAGAAAKDASLHEIRDALHELTALCRGGAQATTSQTIRISSIEDKLQQQETMQGSMDGSLVALLREMNGVVEEVEKISQGVTHLNTELHNHDDDSKLTKTELQTQLKAVKELFSSSCAELKQVSQQVGQMNAERLSLVNSLSMKGGDLEVLKVENQTLHAERERLEANVTDLEERLLNLGRDAESSKAIIDALNDDLRAAKEGMATRGWEIQELQERLEESQRKILQLLSDATVLEVKLTEAEAIVHDNEQRLAASEWAVQQLASEIAKSKSYLTQKEKDEVASKDWVSHLETQLREKERELMEIQCDLENAVKTSNEKHAVVEQLACSKDEVGHVLDLTKRALEERTAALAASELKIKRVSEMQRLTEEALETCKDRLGKELKTSAAREEDMKRLCGDIESAKQESRLADVQVKDLQERLKCLESITEARLESYERKMEKGATDLGEYKDNCASLLELIEKKDAVIHDLELKVEHGRKELVKQVRLTERGEQELTSMSQQLESKTKMDSKVEVELATTDGIIKELDLQKSKLEGELRDVKRSLFMANEDLEEKVGEVEEQRRSIERLQALAAQQGDAYAKKTKELQITSHAVEERDTRVSMLQSALNKAHDDLQTAYGTVSAKEGEIRMLTNRLSEMESLVDKGKTQMSQLQASLQLARANLEAETERVWHQVAARTEIETDRDAWKSKAAALTERCGGFESSISKLQAEVKEWKEVAEHTENLSEMELDAWKARVGSLTESNATMRTEFESSLKKVKLEADEWREIADTTQFLNAELEKSMQAVQESVAGWEKVVISLADEGDVTKRHLEFLLKQVHEEFQCMQEDLVNSKDVMTIARREGNALRDEFLTLKEEQTALAAVTTPEESECQHLQAVISNRQRELISAKAVNSFAAEVSVQEAKEWSQRDHEEWESGTSSLEQTLVDLDLALRECKSDVASVEDFGRNMRLDIENSIQNLRTELEEATCEMLELKIEVTALEARETERTSQYIQPEEFEGCVTALQAEVDDWKEKAAAATEEGLQIKSQFEELLKSLQGELKTWKQIEALAREETRQAMKTEVTDPAVVRVVVGDESDVFSPKSINPFDQEDEGCSSGLEAPDGEDAAIQLQGWKSESSASVAKEGRKLTRQFRASFKHIQLELQSRKVQQQAPRMSKHASFVHRHDDIGLEDLVKALQEEAVIVKAALANWKSKAEETATRKEDLENTISKLKGEVEGWKDRSAMSAGQRIVARRQLDDYAKQVKSLNAELQKWKDVATEANEGSTKLQISLDTAQHEIEQARGETQEWMQKALELNCRTKDLEAEVKKSKLAHHRDGPTHTDEAHLRIEDQVDHLRAEVEKWKSVAVTAEEEGKSAKLELLDTLGKFEDELEVMSSNSIGECSSAGGRSFREEELDCSSSGRFPNDCRHIPSELEYSSLQAEVEDWKKRATRAQKEQEDMKHQNLQPKSRDSSETEVMGIQAELEKWKIRAASAAEECTSLRDTHERAIEELQLELTQWKAKSDAATLNSKTVKEELENVVQDLEHQVRMWKQKAETALEGVMKSQEYEDLIKALEEELYLWTQRTQEGKALQIQLEQERDHLQESLTVTESELQSWKENAAAVTTSIQTSLHDSEKDDSGTEQLESELQKWKSKANDGELLHVELKKVLSETETELQEWKHKAAEYSLVAESLNEELECVIEEGRLEREELSRLESELSVRIQECQGSQSQLQIWEEKAAAITQSTKSLISEFNLTVDEGECQEFENNPIIALRAPLLVWKENVVAKCESELQGWKDRAAAVAVVTTSWKGEFDCILNDNRLQKEKLCNTINDLESELFDWKSKAQEGVTVQLQLEKALSDMESKATATESEVQSLKDELNTTITESSGEIHQLCTAITALEAELSDLKRKSTNDDHHLQTLLTETQSQLHEWHQRATVASQAEEELRQAVEEIRSQTEKLHDFINALKDELVEWQAKAEHLTTSLTSSQAEVATWKQKFAIMEESAPDSHLRNSVIELETELLEWKQNLAQEGELLHQETTLSLTETRMELHEMKENLAALASQVTTQKQIEVALQNLNRQLESDLVLVREEALSRKQKMTQILTQLEGTSNSQKELQSNLHLAQHHLLENDLNLRIRGTSETTKVFESDNVSYLDTPAPFKSTHHQRSKSESPDYNNPAVNQLRQELSSLKSLVSKLGHVRGSDSEPSQAISGVGGGDEDRTTTAAQESESSGSRLLRENQELIVDNVDGAHSRGDVLLQKQHQELVHHAQRQPVVDRSRSHNGARFKVLADVDGNSRRAPPTNSGVTCPTGTPDNITPPSRPLRRTASGV